jgi:putative transposase
VTANPVHRLVKDRGSAESIPSAVQLVAGCTGQDYNQRKKRKGMRGYIQERNVRKTL